jgi:hypothetical protein
MVSLAEILQEVSALAEDDYTLPSGKVVRIRELNAAERLEAPNVARQGGEFNAALFNATVVQMGTLSPPIPKTDIPRLMQGRGGVIAAWANAIWELSEATPESYKSGDTPTNDGQQDAGAGARDAGAGGVAG